MRMLFHLAVSASGPAQSPLAHRLHSINDTLTNSTYGGGRVGAPPEVQLDDSLTSSFRPSLAVIIAVLATMFSLTFLLLLYAKHCKQNAMAVASGEDADSNFAAPARARASGVDRAVVELLPFFKFSSLKGMKEGLECAVCLNAFQESEILRLLPKCKHAFHMECVDKWLEAHSTCPLCRHKVEPDDLLLAEDITGRKSFGSSRRSAEAQVPEDGAVEFFVQRETQEEGERSFRSSRFSIGRFGSSRREGINGMRTGSFRQESVGLTCLDKFSSSGRKDELLLGEAETTDYERFVSRIAHRIIVSDVIFQHRWSDFKPSDLELLDSQMFRSGSSSRQFSLADRGASRLPDSKPLASLSGSGFESAPRPHRKRSAGASDMISKIKDEMERKRKLDKQASRLKSSSSSGKLELLPKSTQPNLRADVIREKLALSSPRRSMSEITSLERFGRTRTRNVLPLASKETSDPSRDEEKTKRWFLIARRTLHWFAGRERRNTASTCNNNDRQSIL